MSGDRPKQPDIVYIQRDLEAIKHTIDSVLRPYRGDLKTVRDENASLRASISRKEADQEALLRIIVKHCPDVLDTALATLLDPNRGGWRTFRGRWRQRLGLEK